MATKTRLGCLPYDDPPRSTVSTLTEVRVKKLAAILRFADELADDNTRTNRFLLENTGNVTPGSEIFHAYAERLQPPKIRYDSRSIYLEFDLNTDTVRRQYRKYDDQRYLFDEICERTFKMYREHLYCRRFMLPEIVFEQITVKIDICTDNYSQVLKTITYTMTERGYPRYPRDLGDVCPAISTLTGDQLAANVNELIGRTDGNIT